MIEDNRIVDLVKDHLKVTSDKPVAMTDTLIDLGADSIDIIEMVILAEETFNIGIDDDRADTVVTVQDFVNVVQRAPAW